MSGLRSFAVACLIVILGPLGNAEAREVEYLTAHLGIPAADSVSSSAKATAGPAKQVFKSSSNETKTIGQIDIPESMLWYGGDPTWNASAAIKGFIYQSNSGILGVLRPKQGGWTAIVENDTSHGAHVSDKGANTWNPDELLKGYKRGVAMQNGFWAEMYRASRSMVILGWQEPPRYDPATHVLIAGLRVALASNPTRIAINYKVHILANQGYITVTFFPSSPEAVSAERPILDQIIKSIRLDDSLAYDAPYHDEYNMRGYNVSALAGGELIVDSRWTDYFDFIEHIDPKFSGAIGAAIGIFIVQWIAYRRRKKENSEKS